MSNIVINSNILIIISILVFSLVIGVILYIIYKDRRQDKEEIEELLHDIEGQEENNIDKLNSLMKNEPEEVSEIELVLEKMQKNLNTKPEEVVANFEKEQEEKAIISYQELVKTLKNGKKDNTTIKVETPVLDEEEEEKPVLEKMLDEIKNPIKLKEIKKQEFKNTNFKNTDFISPIYGKMEEHLEYPKVKSFNKEEQIEQFDEIYDSYNIGDYLEEFSDNNMEIDTLEQTLDLGPISKEIKKNEDFLSALKEFRENL
ncbi:MAG: hypothetical protein PHN42_00880 [Bacilli bacterium]|nr:hypothetical protein [Bacilli bacterium]